MNLWNEEDDFNEDKEAKKIIKKVQHDDNQYKKHIKYKNQLQMLGNEKFNMFKVWLLYFNGDGLTIYLNGQ